MNCKGDEKNIKTEFYTSTKANIIGISEEVWNYRIGGYQVLDKWFKSHKGESLTIEKFDHICDVTGLLAETIKVQEDLRNIRYKHSSSKRCTYV